MRRRVSALRGPRPGSARHCRVHEAQCRGSGRRWCGWATACSPAASARLIWSRSLCQLHALHAPERALYAVYKNYLARPKCSHRARLVLDVPEQCCGVCMPSPSTGSASCSLASVISRSAIARQHCTRPRPTSISGPLCGANEIPVATILARAILPARTATPTHRPRAYGLRKLRELQNPGSGRLALDVETGITPAEIAETAAMAHPPDAATEFTACGKGGDPFFSYTGTTARRHFGGAIGIGACRFHGAHLPWEAVARPRNSSEKSQSFQCAKAAYPRHWCLLIPVALSERARPSRAG